MPRPRKGKSKSIKPDDDDSDSDQEEVKHAVKSGGDESEEVAAEDFANDDTDDEEPSDLVTSDDDDDDDDSDDDSDADDDMPKKRGAKGKKGGASPPTKSGGRKAKAVSSSPSTSKATKASASTTKAKATSKKTTTTSKASSSMAASSSSGTGIGSKRKTLESSGSTSAAGASSGATSASASASGAGAGSGPKRAKGDVVGKEAEEMILRYMTEQNRPYAALQVFENLHEAIKRPLLVKIMDKLTDDGKLFAKLFGKAKIYHVHQDTLASADPDAIAELDEQLEDASSQLKSLKETQQQLQTEVNALESTPTTADAIRMVQQLREAIESKTKRLALIEASAGKIKPEQVDILKQRFGLMLKEWRNRSKACLDMINMALEGGSSSKTPKAWMREKGLELDEEYKADIKVYLQLAEEMQVSLKK